MAIQSKSIISNASRGHHRFTLNVVEDSTSGNSSFDSFSFVLSPLQNGWDWSDWGDRISYQIAIGDNIYTGTIPNYNGSSTVTLKSGNNIEIPHNTDGTKTINISFTVTDTTGQSYTCGNASASDTFKLTDLHKAPDITNCTITAENNSQLSTLGLAIGTIVQYLSNKNFTISSTTYDDATISNVSIYHNNVLIGTSSNNIVQVNFANVSELQTTLSSGTYYVGLLITVTDSKGGYNTRIFNFPVIKYTRPTMEFTSSYIRRKTDSSTTLTDSICVLNFVGTCYKGNDVIGNNNTPQVQYKIWNITEPSYTNATTPNTANITTSTQISNIDYLKTWQYKIKIKDTFIDIDTTPFVKIDKVPTGVSLWSEYRDRVDFLRLTKKGKDIFPNIYSTIEKQIGYWIDDKPLYAKTFVISTGISSGVIDIPHSIADIDIVYVNLGNSFMLNSESGKSYPFPINQYNSATSFDRLGINVDATNIEFLSETGWGNNWIAYVTLEYTKTTD